VSRIRGGIPLSFLRLLLSSPAKEIVFRGKNRASIRCEKRGRVPLYSEGEVDPITLASDKEIQEKKRYNSYLVTLGRKRGR